MSKSDKSDIKLNIEKKDGSVEDNKPIKIVVGSQTLYLQLYQDDNNTVTDLTVAGAPPKLFLDADMKKSATSFSLHTVKERQNISEKQYYVLYNNQLCGVLDETQPHNKERNYKFAELKNENSCIAAGEINHTNKHTLKKKKIQIFCTAEGYEVCDTNGKKLKKWSVSLDKEQKNIQWNIKYNNKNTVATLAYNENKKQFSITSNMTNPIENDFNSNEENKSNTFETTLAYIQHHILQKRFIQITNNNNGKRTILETWKNEDEYKESNLILGEGTKSQTDQSVRYAITEDGKTLGWITYKKHDDEDGSSYNDPNILGSYWAKGQLLEDVFLKTDNSEYHIYAKSTESKKYEKYGSIPENAKHITRKDKTKESFEHFSNARIHKKSQKSVLLFMTLAVAAFTYLNSAIIKENIMWLLGAKFAGTNVFALTWGAAAFWTVGIAALAYVAYGAYRFLRDIYKIYHANDYAKNDERKTDIRLTYRNGFSMKFSITAVTSFLALYALYESTLFAGYSNLLTFIGGAGIAAMIPLAIYGAISFASKIFCKYDPTATYTHGKGELSTGKYVYPIYENLKGWCGKTGNSLEVT